MTLNEFRQKYVKFCARLDEHWPEKADQVILVICGETDLDEFEPTATWIRQCHHRPPKVCLKMYAINHILEGYGCEAVFGDDPRWPDMEYVNMGDTYAATVLHDYTRGTYRVMGWGDWIEESEAAGRVYA